WEVAASIAAETGSLEASKLLARAKAPEIAARTLATTAEFAALQVNQRPTFLIENSIGDRAVFSGVVKLEPLIAVIDAIASDEAAYASWKAHFGDVPPA